MFVYVSVLVWGFACVSVCVSGRVCVSVCVFERKRKQEIKSIFTLSVFVCVSLYFGMCVHMCL
jgi:hypothetical protein